MIAITTNSSTNVKAERTRRILNGQALTGITIAGLSAGTQSFAVYQSAIKRQK